MSSSPLLLDALNFFSADARGLFGPFVNVYLVTARHWSQTDVGLILSVSGLVGIALQTPIGAAIDLTRRKREVVAATMAAVMLAALIVYGWPTFWPMAIAATGLAIAGDAFGPAVAALTLGLTPAAALARRLGRNSAANHAGNVAIALIAAAVGYMFSQRAVFLLAPAFAALSAWAALAIPARAIDHDRARDLATGDREDGEPAGYRILLSSRPFVIFTLCTALFHFANAPLLPLVGQKLALAFPKEATAMTSACVVAAEGVMLPIALIVGARADRWGRRPILIAAFVALPLRAALFTLSNNAEWLIGVQLLDGVGAGIFGALTPLVVADVMRGTGRYNFALGAVATAQGIGASVSALAAGAAVDRFGYTASFALLAGAAAVACLAFVVLMPETAGESTARSDAGAADKDS